MIHPYSYQLTPEIIKEDLRYLELLSRSFPTIAEASTEIINLEAILNLPKPTEHFIADPHGEYEAFLHVLKNASGNIKRKVNDLFSNTLRSSEIRELCTLIYYPEQKLEQIKASDDNIEDFYLVTLNQLIKVCRQVSSKYTHSRVCKSLPGDFQYIIEELLNESEKDVNKQEYLSMIINTIISTQRADDFIIAMCNMIQALAIDWLHLVGDIYDRGPGADIIMEKLCSMQRFDVQWGNHDIDWFGAAAGNDACMANVIRIALRYASLRTLEEGYGINMIPLATFAMETYKDDPCTEFQPHLSKSDNSHSEKSIRMIAQMHKAISIIQFKLEAQIIDRRPEFKMGDRKLLHYINKEEGVCTINKKAYKMKDSFLPTISPEDPYALTPEEQEVVEKLHHNFSISDKLKKHIKCLLAHGGMYTIANSNLMYHASVPLNADGSLKDVMLQGKKYRGKALMDKVEQLIREAFNTDTPTEQRLFAKDFIWYLWCGKNSPLFDKDKMSTFERYFLSDEDLKKEIKGYYYQFRNDEKTCDMILDNFGVTGDNRHIINGHVPVKAKMGEKPIKANGRLLVIDGGFSKAYQPETGIAGYTLVFHSRGLQLVQHQPFTSTQDAIKYGTDIVSTTVLLELSRQRMLVRDTDKGKELIAQIQDLKKLLYAYRFGFLKERR